MEYPLSSSTTRRVARTPLRALRLGLLAGLTLWLGCGRSSLSNAPISGGEDPNDAGLDASPDASLDASRDADTPEDAGGQCHRVLTARGVGDALVEVDTRGAPSRLTGECGGDGPEVIVDWTPTRSGTFKIDTLGSAAGTVLYAYDLSLDGPCADAQVPGACSDSSSDPFEFTTRSGTTHVTLVLDSAAGGGRVQLNVREVADEPEQACDDGRDNDDDGRTDCDDEDCKADSACTEPCDSIDLSNRTGLGVAKGTTSGTRSTYTGSCGGEDSPEQLFTWRAPHAGEFAFDTSGSLFDTVLYAVRVGESCDLVVERPDACGDDQSASDLSSRITLQLALGDMVGLVVDGYQSRGYYELNIEALSGGLEICDNGLDDDLNKLTDCDDPACAMQPECDAPVACPEQDLGMTLTPVMGSTDGGSQEIGNACGGLQAPERTFLWTAPFDGRFRLHTSGSKLDTILSVYAGDAVCSDTKTMPLACNDDGRNRFSELEFDAFIGDSYVIVVDGWAQARGDFILHIESDDMPPPMTETSCDDSEDDDGDGKVDCDDSDCAAAMVCQTPPPPDCFSRDLDSAVGLRVARGTTVGGMTMATGSCGGDAAPEALLRWTAPEAGAYQFDTFGSQYDTLLYLWEATNDCRPMELPKTCNDNARQGVQSLLTVSLTKGEALYVVVDGAGLGAGNYNLNIKQISDQTGPVLERNCFDGLDDDSDGDVDCKDSDCATDCIFD